MSKSKNKSRPSKFEFNAKRDTHWARKCFLRHNRSVTPEQLRAYVNEAMPGKNVPASKLIWWMRKAEACIITSEMNGRNVERYKLVYDPLIDGEKKTPTVKEIELTATEIKEVPALPAPEQSEQAA